MADRKMKMRIRSVDDGAELQVLIEHPMETGLRTNKNTGNKIPPHFIQRVTVEHNGKLVITVNTGAGVSEDPLLGFRIKGAKQSDKLRVFWTDNMGESGALEGTVDVS